MSKNKIHAIIILGIILIPFFVYKIYRLSANNFYEGKVIRIEIANVSLPRVTGRSGGYEKVYMPEIEYVNDKGKVIFLEGRHNPFAFFYNVGDNVTVLEDKLNKDKTGILGLWYCVKMYEIILIFLLSFIVLSIFWGIRTGYFKEDTKKS